MMELLDSFFIKRKHDVNTLQSRDYKRSSSITPEQVRLLLFKECDWRGRKLLFDSSTIERTSTNKHDKLNLQQKQYPYIVEISEGFSYVYKGPAEDSSFLGEMIFGAVAMNYRGVSLKIHMMEEPTRLMCSKVFCVPSSRRRIGNEKSSGGLLDVNTVNVPLQSEEGMSLSFSLDRGDSGYYEDHSPHSSVGSTYDYFSILDAWDSGSHVDYSFTSPSSRKLSSTSNGSWQRRTYQSLATRFDLGYQSSNILHVPTAPSNTNSSDSQLTNAGGTTESLVSTGSSTAQRKNKLGLAVVITVDDNNNEDLVERCLEHSPQLQALVCRLRLAAMAAGASAGAGAGAGFVATLYRATRDAATWLSDLLYGPRLQPMWLTIASCKETRVANKMAEVLLADLCALLTVADTKSTNFFISTLLTHVLTHHLGWVTTVSPYDIVNQEKDSTLDDLKRPYNALWAQLGDLCGSIGLPPRSARTIIRGKDDKKIMKRLLGVLTYFLRCGDVTKKSYNCEKFVLEEKVMDVNKLQSSVSNTHSSSTLLTSDVSLKKSPTLASFNQTLSSSDFSVGNSGLKRNATMMIPLDSSTSSSSQSLTLDGDVEEKVVFVLGDNEKLVGLKNKSLDGRSVKKSTKANDTENVGAKCAKEDVIETDCAKETCDKEDEEPKQTNLRAKESPSKCCSTLQHSKPLKHSGFKFEFDKYPQIVTNYMKSKNLEILDRHYLGKPGNLKLDNFQFDPTVVPPIQEERCETCYQCQMMETMLQTPTNASELEYMNDIPGQSEPQYAKQSIVSAENIPQVSPKNFIKVAQPNTLVVNVSVPQKDNKTKPVEDSESFNTKKLAQSLIKEKHNKLVKVEQIIEFPISRMSDATSSVPGGFKSSLLGGVTDHYVPDLVLQGTTANQSSYEMQLRRDLDLTTYLYKSFDVPIRAVAIVGDINTWEVRVVGREGAGGMSALVAAALEALPAMSQARVPAHQCLSFLEGKLREFCVISKTLADMLMSTDFCDIDTLTKALNIDVNDVPLLLAVATTHTPQVARRYGISYR